MVAIAEVGVQYTKEAMNLAGEQRDRARFLAAWACSTLWSTSPRVAYERLFGAGSSIDVYEWRMPADFQAEMMVCLWLCKG
jgi:hypothetical protein